MPSTSSPILNPAQTLRDASGVSWRASTIVPRGPNSSRPASMSADVELALGRIHDGRAFASRTVDVLQAGRRCAPALVLIDIDEADQLRQGPDMPAVGAPNDAIDVPAPRGRCFPGSEVRVVDGVDTYDPHLPPGPAEMLVWTRYPASPSNRVVSQAILAFGTDGYLIGTAMRPRTLREGEAHNTVSTGVVSHTSPSTSPSTRRTGSLSRKRAPTPVEAGRTDERTCSTRLASWWRPSCRELSSGASRGPRLRGQVPHHHVTGPPS